MIPKKEIPIFFTIDNGYAPYISVAIQSIIENASKEYNYKLIVLHQELNEENIQKISSLAKENFAIKFVYMKDGLEAITDRIENRLRCNYFTLTIYFRLFIPDMFPEYDKGIYIDSDVVVPGDISKLYNTELEDNLIGACNDVSVIDVPELAKYIEEAVGVSRYEYINSGVLLMNLKEMREKKFTERFLNLLNKYHFDTIAPDQDYLNAICNGKILYLDGSWDAMPTDGKQPLENPNIVHYNLFQKPWCYDNIQYEDYFWKYAKKTNYYDEIINHKNNYSEQQKQSDRECLGILIEKGGKMSENEVTFKKVMEKGEKIRIWE